MKVEMLNVGSIKMAEVEIRPITVICGQTLSGKSTVVDSINAAFSHYKPNVVEPFVAKYAKKWPMTVTLRNIGGSVSICNIDDRTSIGYSSQKSKEEFSSGKFFCTLYTNTWFPEADHYPLYFSKHAEKGSIANDIMGDYMSAEFHTREDSKNIFIKCYQGDIEIVSGCAFQGMALNIIRISELLRLVQKSNDPRVKTFIVIIKHPEVLLSNTYIRKYMAALLDLWSRFRSLGVDFRYVIETSSPAVVGSIGDRIYGTRTNGTKVRKLIKSPSSVIVYGMQCDEGHCRVLLTGQYDWNGFLDGWKTGFLFS